MVQRIALPPRLQGGAIQRCPNGWIVWLHTDSYQYGTYLWLGDNGLVDRITEYPDEGPRVEEIIGYEG